MMKLTRDFLKRLILEEMRGVQEVELPSENASTNVQAAFDSITGPEGTSQIAFITAENPPRAEESNFPRFKRFCMRITFEDYFRK